MSRDNGQVFDWNFVDLEKLIKFGESIKCSNLNCSRHKGKANGILLHHLFLWIFQRFFFRRLVESTLGGIASICFRFHIQQTLRIKIQGSQGCQKIRKIMRIQAILIARSIFKLKIDNFFSIFECIFMYFLIVFNFTHF